MTYNVLMGTLNPTHSLTHSFIHSIVSYDGIYNFGGTGGKSNVFNKCRVGKSFKYGFRNWQ